jgi:chromosome segregation ATPase
MFAATDDESGIEALIDERSRELEVRTEQLAAIISDVEAREERAAEIRNAVEDILRRGSSELDDRHSELEGFASELISREQRLVSAEAALASRKQELGAVELRRAAVERREEAVTEREHTLEAIADELRARDDRLAEIETRERELAEQLARIDELQDAATTSTATADAHVVIVPGDRYQLVVRDGPPPDPGSWLELGGVELVVMRLAASPLPGDRRPCVIVEIARRGEADASPRG